MQGASLGLSIYGTMLPNPKCVKIHLRYWDRPSWSWHRKRREGQGKER